MVLAMKNKYATRARISERQFRQILLLFSLDRASSLVITPRVFGWKQFTKSDRLLEGPAVLSNLAPRWGTHPQWPSCIFISSPRGGGIWASAGKL